MGGIEQGKQNSLEIERASRRDFLKGVSATLVVGGLGDGVYNAVMAMAEASELTNTHPRPGRANVVEAQNFMNDLESCQNITNGSCESAMKPEAPALKEKAERILEQEEIGKREYDKRVKPYAIKILFDIGAMGTGAALILATWWREADRTNASSL